jgi:hypothetical protein
MSITALVFVGLYVAGLVAAFRNPMFGLCAYLWAFYNHPPSRWWGSELPDLRWSLIAAAVTLAAYVIHTLAGEDTPEGNQSGRTPEMVHRDNASL